VKRITIAAQRLVSSDREDAPYATEVTIHTTVDITPTWLALRCDAEIVDVYCYVNQGNPLVILRSCGHTYSEDRKTVWFHFQEPTFSPQTPLIVTLKGKSKITAESVSEEYPPIGLKPEPGGGMCFRKRPDDLE
jgi:hypothetical protein